MTASAEWIWSTDVHLNHVNVDRWDDWVASIRETAVGGDKNIADGLILTGDISESEDIVFQLRRIAEAVEMPIHFVLGNHDFYQSSFAKTRAEVVAASREDPQINYLTDLHPIALNETSFLIGEDGWGDATVGDYHRSNVFLNDFLLIEDFRASDPSLWYDMLGDLGRHSADRLQDKLLSVPKRARNILVVTHVPPFRESCWYEGKTSDDNWAPFFVCGKVGNVLLRHAEKHPEQQITVLCGHTHHAGVARMADNLIVHTGSAIYGSPAVNASVEIHDRIVVKTI